MGRNISKQDIENCMRKAIKKNHIPNENEIRNIVRTEIEKYYKKEELEQKQPFSNKFNEYFRQKKYKDIGWYLLMFMLSSCDVLGFKILTEGIQKLIDKSEYMKVLPALLILFGVAVLLSIFITFSIKVYDKMLEKDYKHAKIICFLEILFWCNIFLPNISSWIENIL